MIPSSDIRRPQLAILNENPNNQGAIYKEQESNDPSKKSSTIKNDKSNDTELQRYFAFSKRIPKNVKRFCGICRQHGLLLETRGHDCAFTACECDKCQLVRSRRQIMTEQIRVRRDQERRFQRTTEPGEANLVPILTIGLPDTLNETSALNNSPLSSTLSPYASRFMPLSTEEGGSYQNNSKTAGGIDLHSLCYFCQKCKNHGLLVWKKNHKRVCPYTTCHCEFCDLIETRRQVGIKNSKERNNPLLISCNPLDQYIKAGRKRSADQQNNVLPSSDEQNSSLVSSSTVLDTISKKKLAKRDSVFGTEDNESLASSDTTTITARMNDLADVSFLSSAYSADDRTLKIGLNKESCRIVQERDIGIDFTAADQNDNDEDEIVIVDGYERTATAGSPPLEMGTLILPPTTSSSFIKYAEPWANSSISVSVLDISPGANGIHSFVGFGSHPSSNSSLPSSAAPSSAASSTASSSATDPLLPPGLVFDATSLGYWNPQMASPGSYPPNFFNRIQREQHQQHLICQSLMPTPTSSNSSSSKFSPSLMRQNINLQQLSQQESIEQLLCALFGPVSSSVSTTFVGSNNAHQNQGRTKTSQCQPPFCMQSAGWSPSSPSTIAATTNVWNKEWLSRMLLQQEQLNGTDSDYYLGNTDTTTIRTTALISHLIELERQQQKHEANEAKQRIAHLQQQLQQQMAIDTQITSRQLLLGTLEQAFACGGFGSK